MTNEIHNIPIGTVMNWDSNFNGGKVLQVKFDNGFGISVVKHDGSYGHEQGLWEIAVIKYDETGDFNLRYDTPITDDVLGYQSTSDVFKVARQVAALPKE